MRTIYKNGVIYTGELPFCEAFVVDEGNFIYTGTNQGAIEFSNQQAEQIDLNGLFVCAGFNDSHMHLLNFGNTLRMADLSKHTESILAVKQAVRMFMEERKVLPGEWVRGRGWNQDYFAEDHRFLTRYDLDDISTEQPICLIRACGHACVVNTAALNQLNITGEIQQIYGGKIDIDENGELLGIFREQAMDLVYASLPEPEITDLKDMILEGSRALSRYGITSVQTDDFLAVGNGFWKHILEAFLELEKEGKLTVRINQQAQFTEPGELKCFIEEGYCTGWGSEWFRIGPLKLVGDGSLGARTAYLSEPYADDPTTQGISIFSREQLKEMVGYAHTHGMQVAVHAIGDGCLDDILSVYETVLTEYPRADHRHGIVHCQIMRKDQVEKIKALSLHSYIQSIFLDYDIHIVENRVGKTKAGSSYVFKTLYEISSASNGSDCPVEFPDVMAGIQCAVTRKSLKDIKTGHSYLPEQALNVQEALNSYTIHGALASFEEDRKGKILPGMMADFVMLDQNPFETESYNLKNIRVLKTYVDGICQYQSEEEDRSF